MKHNLMIPLINFNGVMFTTPITKPDGSAGSGPLTLKSVLENACVNASPHEYPTGEQKMQVFQLLLKIHAAAPFAELTAEDVSLLKRLVGGQATVAAVGAVFNALENPVQDHIKTLDDGTPPQ